MGLRRWMVLEGEKNYLDKPKLVILIAFIFIFNSFLGKLTSLGKLHDDSYCGSYHITLEEFECMHVLSTPKADHIAHGR